MADGRRNNGSAPLLADEDLAALDLSLQSPPPDGGLWSGPKVAAWISGRVGVECTNKTGWSYLKRLGYSVQRPRPRHPDADEKAQAAFKKGGLPIGLRALLLPIETPSSRSGRWTKLG